MWVFWHSLGFEQNSASCSSPSRSLPLLGFKSSSGGQSLPRRHSLQSRLASTLPRPSWNAKGRSVAGIHRVVLGAWAGWGRTRSGIGASFNPVRSWWMPAALGSSTTYVSLNKTLPHLVLPICKMGGMIQNKSLVAHIHTEIGCQGLAACMVYWIVLLGVDTGDDFVFL